ncbi:unnamed protein product [Zymoseptoria tritici ST99CH_3D1]|nr:unnamed protein product [Zymoseptoria tritici ST99CH_3D1]
MHRILSSGGVFGSTIWSKAQIAEPWNKACSKLDSTFESNDAAFSSAWGGCQDLEQGLKKAGFVDVRSEEREIVMRFESAEAFAEYWLEGGNPALLRWSANWKGEKERVRGELMRIVREEFGNGRIEMVAASVIGRKV